MRVSFKVLANRIGKVLRSRYTLLFVNGFLLATLIYFYIEDSDEKRLFEAMAAYVKERTADINYSEESILLQSLHLTYYLGKSRAFIFNNKEVNSLKASLFHPVTADLMTTNGACGSYAYILSRLLTELHVTNRIAQMKVNGLYGGHILVEAKTAKGWVVLDGSYDLYFKRPDGKMASFTDLQNNWQSYRNQVPGNYDSNYRYEGVRYANWNKIPVMMPMMKKISYFILGKERTEGLSFRTLLLRKFHVLFQVTTALYLLLLVFVIFNYYRRNRQAIAVYLPALFSSRQKQEAVVNSHRKSA